MDSSTFSGSITGSGGLRKEGGGTQTISGCANDYTGPTTINGGTIITDCIRDGLVASGIGASSAASTNLVLASSGVLQYTGGDVATDRGFTLQGGWGFIDVVQAAAELEFEGSVVGAGSLAKRGAGTLILSGTNTSTGSTSVEAGTLVAGSAQAFGSGLLYSLAGTRVDTTGFNNTVQGLSDNNTAGGVIDIGERALTLSAGGASFAGKITGTTGNLVKIGGGTQVLSGCENDYEGSTTIGGGWLRITCVADGGEDSSIGASSNAAANLVIGGPANAGLEYVGDGDATDRRFTLGAGAGYIYNNGTGALEFTNTAAVSFAGTGTRQFRLGGSNTATNIMAAQIVNNGTSETSLVKEDAGIWRLTNATSTYTGITTIQNGGVLEVVKLADGGRASSIGAATADNTRLVINTGSHLRYVGAGDSTNRLFRLGTGATYIESSGTGAIDFTGTGGGTMGFAGAGPRTLALGGSYTGDNIMGVVIQDQDATTGKTTLAKNDAGTWILTANNTYTGNTVINDGKLIVGNGGAAGNVGTGEVILAFDTGVLGFNRSDTFNFAGKISGPGTIEQMGEGTTVLTAANSAGVTSITEGALQIDGTLTTDTISFDDNESTTLTVNGTVTGNGLPVTIAGDGVSNIININPGGTLTATGDLGGGSDTVNVSATLDTGAGVLGLGQGNDTLVLNDTAVFSGGGVDAGTGGESGVGDTLRIVQNSSFRILDAGTVTGFESLTKQGAGALVLTGAHEFSSGTTVEAGTLMIGDGTTAGSIAGDIRNDGTVAFNNPGSQTYSGTITGSGGLQKQFGGTLVLTGNNAYTGNTWVYGGALIINGDQSGATGRLDVNSRLGGAGIIGGDVRLGFTGTIDPGSGSGVAGTLTIRGDLAFGIASTLQFDFGAAGEVGGPLNDLIEVGGNLTLDGTLNITQTPGGTFGPGVYRIFNYGSDLTDNGLSVADPAYFVQTSVDKQVNLVNSAGLTLSYWDGDAGPHSNGTVDGGSGIWRAAGDDNWTDSTGLFAAPFANGSFAIFQGAAGTVDVDSTTNGQVQAVGMQFATSGYVVQGEGIVLVDDSTQAGLQSVIRVGDGSAAGAGYVATIASALSGTTQLVKTDLGTLVLSGTNSYSGGTAINGGTIEISADANLGAAGGALSLGSGGVLRNTAAVVSNRAATLNAGGGTFETLDTLTLNGAIGGTGTLTKVGGATLVLSGTNTYQGGTVINGGTIAVSANANLGNAAGALTLDGGTLHTTGSFTAARNVTLNAGGGTFDADNGTVLTLANAVTGAGALSKEGLGTLVLAGDNGYAGGTTISNGRLQLGDGGASGAITGNVLDNGTLTFNRNNSYTFAGLISGSGALEQIGSGTTILTANNSYGGDTVVSEGRLIVNGDQSAATGATTVEDGGTLGGIGTIGGDVAVLDGGTLNPGNPGTTPGTLTINGNLTLDPNATLDYNFGQAGVVGGPYNDLTVVHGDLVLDGTINVTETPGGDFGPGIYRVISYDGALTDLGLSATSPVHVVQTSIDGQVNLVDISATTLNFWDGDAGDRGDDLVNGGHGTWRAAGDDNWTDDAGHINAAFSNGSFAVFAGAAGTVEVDSTTNGQVRASGMQFATDGYAIQGENIELVGPQSIIRVGDGTAAGAGFVATIASTIDGNSQLVKTDQGTLVLEGANTYTGGTAVNGGTLEVSSDANLGNTAGNLTFDGGALRNTADMTTGRGVTFEGKGTFLTNAGSRLILNGTLSGAGAFHKAGDGTLVLTADSGAYAGSANIDAGTLDMKGVLGGSISVGKQGRLQGVGRVGATSNSGVIAPGSDGIGSLTVQGNYTGNDGQLHITSALEGDSSKTSRLVVNGATSGTTQVSVTNREGLGGQTVEGIKIIDVAGASNGKFTLDGDYLFQGEQAVVAGAYGYRLFKGGVATPTDGDWYLRSTYLGPNDPEPRPLYAPGVPLYEAYAGILQSFNQLDSLQQRVGNRSWGEGATPQGADLPALGPVDSRAIWARIEAARSQLEPTTSTTGTDYDVTTWKLQAGVDGLLQESEAGALIGGITAHYGTVSSNVSSMFGTGSVDATGYGFGGTLTWYAANGFYIDAQADATWYDSDIRSATLGTTLADGNDGFGYALSIEAGQKIAVGGNWTLTPQAQLAYSAVDFDKFTDPYGALVSLGNSESLIGRIGLSADHENQWIDDAGQVSRSHVYGVANLYYDFLDGSDVDVSGVSLVSKNKAVWGGIGLGGSLSWADGRYSVYGEAFARASFENFGGANALGAKIGFNVKW